MTVFKETSPGCPHCSSNLYRRRTGFHLWFRFHCEICDMNFHSPKWVKNRTSSTSFDNTYENINKTNIFKRRKYILSAKILVALTVLISIPFIISNIGITPIWIILAIIIMYLIIFRKPRRRRRW